MATHLADKVGPSTTATADDELAASPLLIPVPEVARVLGISRSTAYRCAASGGLPSAHLGGRVYVVRARLRDLLSA